MSRRPSLRSRCSTPEGFTLIEVMIAIVLTGILTTVLFQLIQGQSRFTEAQTGRQVVQGNVRASMELIASELRAVPAGGLVVANSTRLRVRVPRVYGVACNAFAASGTLWIAVPAGTRPADLPAAGTWTAIENWGLAFAAPPAGSGQFSVGRIASRLADTGGPTACAGLSLTATSVEYIGITVPTTTIPAATVAAGGQVHLFQEVEYSVGDSAVAGMSGRWLMRANGVAGSLTATTPRQPLAGPLMEVEGTGITGVNFRYLCNNAVLATPVTPTNTDQVRVVLAMRSRTGTDRTIQEQVDSTTIHLRNSERTTCP